MPGGIPRRRLGRLLRMLSWNVPHTSPAALTAADWNCGPILHSIRSDAAHYVKRRGQSHQQGVLQTAGSLFASYVTGVHTPAENRRKVVQFEVSLAKYLGHRSALLSSLRGRQVMRAVLERKMHNSVVPSVSARGSSAEYALR